MTAPQWLEELRGRIAGAFQCPEQVILRAQWTDEDDGEEPYWELVACPTLREIVGGKYDGERVFPRLIFDVEALSRIFDEVLGVTLDGGCVPLIPAGLRVCGLYLGNRVRVQVLLAPPEDAEPLDLLDAFTGEVVPRRQ